MSRHIIFSFIIMLIQMMPLWYQPIQNSLHIFSHRRITIFIDTQPRRSMQDKHVTHAYFIFFKILKDRTNHFICNQITSSFPRLQRDRFLIPFSHTLHYILIDNILYIIQLSNNHLEITFRMSSQKKMFMGVLGIYSSYIALSYLVERLFQISYGDIISNQGQPGLQFFKFPSLVTWVGCLFCTIYGIIYAQYIDTKPNEIIFKERVRLGLLFTLNYLPTNYSLMYIPYPIQVVAKNTRYIIVVIIGIFFSRVKKSKELKLPKSKFVIAVVITLGAVMFMLASSKKEAKEHSLDPNKTWIGYILIFVAIISDGLFSDSQAYCKSVYKPTPNQLFLASNLYGFLLIFLFALFSGQLYLSLKFCLKYPRVIIDICLIGILQVTGQISVYYVISNFKQHIYPLISTTRKIFTILLSIFLFNHAINKIQWVCIIVVFIGMGYEIYDEIRSQDMHKSIKKSKRKGSNTSNASSEIAEEENLRNSKNSEAKSNKSHKSIKSKLAKQLSFEQEKKKDESLSKYRYSWRLDQIANNKQTELSPEKEA